MMITFLTNENPLALATIKRMATGLNKTEIFCFVRRINLLVHLSVPEFLWTHLPRMVVSSDWTGLQKAVKPAFYSTRAEVSGA